MSCLLSCALRTWDKPSCARRSLNLSPRNKQRPAKQGMVLLKWRMTLAQIIDYLCRGCDRFASRIYWRGGDTFLPGSRVLCAGENSQIYDIYLANIIHSFRLRRWCDLDRRKENENIFLCDIYLANIIHKFRPCRWCDLDRRIENDWVKNIVLFDQLSELKFHVFILLHRRRNVLVREENNNMGAPAPPSEERLSVTDRLLNQLFFGFSNSETPRRRVGTEGVNQGSRTEEVNASLVPGSPDSST